MAMRHAISQRLNIIWSSPLGNPDTAHWMHNLFQGTGYTVDVAFVSVDAARSKLAILHRYQRGRDPAGTGRIVGFDYHDQQYAGLTVTAERIEAQRLADGVHVYNRDGLVRYSNQLVDGHWRRAPSAPDAIAAERARQWTSAEMAGFRSIAGWLGRTGNADPPPHLFAEHECSPLAADLRPQLAEAVTTALAHVRGTRVTAASVRASRRGHTVASPRMTRHDEDRGRNTPGAER